MKKARVSHFAFVFLFFQPFAWAVGPDLFSCREAIPDALCLVDHFDMEASFEDRPCAKESRDYAPFFEQLYDRYPPHFQKMFCHLKRIYIEKENFPGSAYGGLVMKDEKDPNSVLGGMIGTRKAFLDNLYTLDQWASWKEQVSFGADPARVDVAAELPKVYTSMDGDPIDLLYFLVAHEFGHIFDFTNGLDKKAGWWQLSWKEENGNFLDPFNFLLFGGLCFYSCQAKFISPDRQDELYQSLSKTNFLSTYSTSHSSQDFAEALAFYTIMTERNASYQVLTPSGVVYDPIQRLRSDPMLLPKKRFIENFLISDYQYPGEGKAG